MENERFDRAAKDTSAGETRKAETVETEEQRIEMPEEERESEAPAEKKQDEEMTAPEEKSAGEEKSTEEEKEELPGEDENGKPEEDPKLRRLEQELSEQKDKYLRLYAEFDNFRKRSDKEKSQMFDMGAKDVIEKLLPVVDNFERALTTVEEADREDAFTKGVEGIYRQIQKLFADLEVKPIEAEGQKFDPAFHNAVMTDADADCEEDIITEDLLKGYTYRGTVVRHSMVKVKK